MKLTHGKIGKNKIIKLFKRYSLIRGGKEDGVFQKFDIKDWTNKKGLNMTKDLQTLLQESNRKAVTAFAEYIEASVATGKVLALVGEMPTSLAQTFLQQEEGEE